MTLFSFDLQCMCITSCPSFSIFSPFFCFITQTQLIFTKWFSVFILIFPCFSCGLTNKLVKNHLRFAYQYLNPNIQISSQDQPDSNYSAFQSSEQENVTLNLPCARLREEPPEVVLHFIRVHQCSLVPKEASFLVAYLIQLYTVSEHLEAINY